MTEHDSEFQEYCQDPRAAATIAALRALPYEEPPRRIAFVSDKVFEPTWWQRLWAAPKWGFASAALLSGAIFFHAATRPATIVQTTTPPAVQQTAAAPAPNVDALVQAAVARATADLEARYQARTTQLVKAAEERLLIEHRQDMAAMDASNQMMLRKLNTYMRASNDLGAGQ
ncbi:MAG: hypothetical protein J0L64_22350 [Acidobacteria bacterium]|nr:hypothetical protein [Acidobacteriota bacterium]